MDQLRRPGSEIAPEDRAPNKILASGDRSSWIRLRTLILLRWFAITGQVTALTVAHQYYGLVLELGLCYLAVGVSVVANIVAILIFPENKRLTEGQNFLLVLFDLLQLGFLLFLTGGLHNPFALLLLGPVTISAAVLNLRSFILIGTTAIAITSLLSQFFIPLRTVSGANLMMPDIFLFGTWSALIIAIVFIGAHSRRVSNEMTSMSTALAATQLALAREQKLTDLGGVVAAAAHELGTPLATIKLASSELIEELSEHPELREDAELIRDQADRCRVILRDMGRAGKDDVHLRRAPLSTLMEEAAEPHAQRGIQITYSFTPLDGSHAAQPTVLRKPEIIHGLRNLVQNAVDFADRNVWIDASWSDSDISIRIADDGPGFPPQLIGRIGDPFVRRSRRTGPKASAQREGYDGMGLGLFIAKTLLERSGADLLFTNGGAPEADVPENVGRIGALVEVAWPRAMVEASAPKPGIGLGQNRRIDTSVFP